MSFQARWFLSDRVLIPGLTSLGLWAAVGSGPALAAGADPTGTWTTEDGRARIRVEMCGPARAKLCGFVVWTRAAANPDGQPRLDAKNPDPEKRTRPILGHQLMLGLTAAADGRFGGKIYNAEDGKQYDVTVYTDGADTLKVRGCLIAFLCSTQTWTRASGPVAGQLTAATGQPGGPRLDPDFAAATPARARDAKPRS